GITTAYWLAHAGKEVCVIDRQPEAALQSRVANLARRNAFYLRGEGFAAAETCARGTRLKCGARYCFNEHNHNIAKRSCDASAIRYDTLQASPSRRGARQMKGQSRRLLFCRQAHV